MPCCLLIWTDFKNVNDKLGHGAGDKLLEQAGGRIKACVRDIDTVARMGGDEFTIILLNVGDSKQVKTIAEKILNELTSPFISSMILLISLVALV